MSSFVCGRPHWGRRWVTLQLQTSVVSEIKRRKKSSTSSCEDFAARSHAPVTRRLASGDNSWRREIFPSARTFPVEHLPLRWAAAYLGILCYQNVANTHIARQILFIFWSCIFVKLKCIGLKNDVQPVTQLPQSRRQVHDVLSAAESVPPISDSEVTCGPTTRPATLSSSATSSSNSTDFSSSSSSSSLQLSASALK